MAQKKINISEEKLNSIISSSIKKHLDEGFLYRTRPEGKPQNLNDVIKGNGWKARLVSKTPEEMVLRLYRDSDSFLGYDDPLPFEELVEDINIYFEDKPSHLRASGYFDNGSFIKISRKLD